MKSSTDQLNSSGFLKSAIFINAFGQWALLMTCATTVMSVDVSFTVK